MAGNESWTYQGRQYHMWFGHGTKPLDAKAQASRDGQSTLAQEIIASVGHTLPANLPVSKRSHPVARLGPADHARLTRLLTGLVAAIPLGTSRLATRVLAKPPDAPGVASFLKAAATIAAARTTADARDASDLVGRSAQEMGLDQFRPFLRNADDHLAAQGGLDTLLRELPTPAAKPAPIPRKQITPSPHLPPGRPTPPSKAAPRGPGLMAIAAAIADFGNRNREAQVQAAIEQYGLNPSDEADRKAAAAYAWAASNPSLRLETGFPEAAQDAIAEQVMWTVRADPGLLDRAMAGDVAALSAIRDAVRSTPGFDVEKGFGYEIRNDEERELVNRLLAEGRAGSEIQDALANLRGKRAGFKGDIRPPRSDLPPTKQIPPEQLRFSQRSAGGNGRAEQMRRYIQKYGTISSPVDVVETPDGLVTIDNTRVALAREFGLKLISVRVWKHSDTLPADVKRRFRKVLKNWGDAIAFRLSDQRNQLPPTGTTTIPKLPPRSGE